jgi:hypothetical protein
MYQYDDQIMKMLHISIKKTGLFYGTAHTFFLYTQFYEDGFQQTPFGKGRLD